MRLQLQTPQELWPERPEVRKILVETSRGLLGILPRHADCLVTVHPGILTVQTEQGLEHLAVHRGLLVKRGSLVTLSAGERVGGALPSLTALLRSRQDGRQQSEEASRSAQHRLEAGLVRRFMELKQT